MLNQIVLVGRITKEPELKELESGKKVCNLTLAVQKPFKNLEGVYETDFINTALWDHIAENTVNYCHKGDVVGIKGRLQSRDNKLEVVTEKLSFLSKSKEGQEEIEERKEEDYER